MDLTPGAATGVERVLTVGALALFVVVAPLLPSNDLKADATLFAAAGSAIAALRLALDTLLRLFAPFLPYVTEEVWSWWRRGSVHRAPWPGTEDLEVAAGDADPLVYEVGAWVLGEIRRTKALAKVSLKTEVEQVVVADVAERLVALAGAERDLREAGKVRALVTTEAADPSVQAVLQQA